VPPGFEVRLFASEPEVVNPVATTWTNADACGCLNFTSIRKACRRDKKGRDRIKILEDTDGDGKADKVTVFADGFSLATGLALATAASMSARRRISIFFRTPTATTRRT